MSIYSCKKKLKKNYKKDLFFDNFRVKNNRIWTIFLISNRSLRCEIDAIYIDSKFKYFKLVISIYIIYYIIDKKHKEFLSI